jgi:pimeloyl-ACP methyl ester carboxylesterase
VLALDLPGLGSTQAPPKAWGLDDYAQFLTDFLHKLGHKKIYAILGHSNGGAVAIRGVANGMIEADKVILVSAAGIRDTLKTRKLLLKLLAKAGKLATLPLPRKARNRIRLRFYGSIGSDLLVVEHMQATFKKVVNQDVQADATHLVKPTLLIYGSNDTDTPPAYGMLYASLLPQAKLHEIDGAGHFVHQEKPQLVNEMIEDFLDD